MDTMQRQVSLEYWAKKFKTIEVDQLNPPGRSLNAERMSISFESRHFGVDTKRLLDQKSSSMFVLAISVLSVVLTKMSIARQRFAIPPLRMAPGSSFFFLFCTTTKELSFTNLVDYFKDELSSSARHLNYDFFKLTEYLFDNGTPQEAMFNVTFALKDYNDYTNDDINKCDVFFELQPHAHGLELKVAGKSTSNEYLSQLCAAFFNVLNQVLSNEDISIASISLASATNNSSIERFNNTNQIVDDTTLINLFEASARKYPNAIALQHENREWSYQQLNAMVNRLAHTLRKEFLVKEGDIVGVLFPKHEWMMISVLAVLKCGAAYMPMDIDFPDARVQFMVDDAALRLVLGDSAKLADIKNVKQFDPSKGLEILDFSEENPENVVTPSNVAYVIYTSGSTGQPKGVMVEHRGVVNRISWMWHFYGFSHEDRVLQKTTYVFDVSVWEIFMPLAFGARVVLCPKEKARDPKILADMIQRYGITTLHFVPSLYDTFLMELAAGLLPFLRSLRHIFVSGEMLTWSTVQKHYASQKIPLHNLYGPTEASVDVSYYKTDIRDQVVPIGYPIWNMKMYVLDEHDKPLPEHLIGQIGLAGIGLARGYLNRVELTAEKFKTDLIHEREVVYMTGDVGRWSKKYGVEYINRKDGQVKVRGFRIETGEIEQAVRSFGGIRHATVAILEVPEMDRGLVAIYQAETTALSKDALIEYLLTVLPDYMIPSYYHQVESVPLTNNGKVDRAKLLAEATKSIRTKRAGMKLASSDIEVNLHKCWIEVLKVPAVSIDENFFGVGGNSLKVVELQKLISGIYPGRLEIHEIFSNTSIEKQAVLISGRINQIINQHDTINEIEF